MNPMNYKLQLQPTIIYRTPQFPFNVRWHECWQELKRSISVSASQEFNELLELVQDEQDLRRLPENVQQTIWKYFNRATYRSTPYGAFAAIGTAAAGKDQPGNGLVIKEQVLHWYPDWLAHRQIDMGPELVFDGDCWLQTNSTWYPVGEDIRYVSKEASGYELTDITPSALIMDILYACTTPRAASSVWGQFSETYGQAEVKENIIQMLADQLLFSSAQPNLTGPEYFERIGFKAQSDARPYIIAERLLASGTIDYSLLRHVPELVARLAAVLPSYHSPELSTFAKAFAWKFGEKEVPLMVALDPELGVGYGNMDQQYETALIEKLKSFADSDQDQSTQDFLIKALISERADVINLEDLQLPSRSANLPLANTVPVVCTVSDELLYLEYAGGATANAILGRFTLALPDVERHCRAMAGLEQAANPDVLFFDISYTIGTVTDNVNRRKHIYPFQLCIHNFDTSADPLRADDLMVSVQGEQVYLRSHKSGKRLVPRFASGYNYLFSDLPLFRFLCDLQHQQIHKNLSLKLRERIKGLNYYPRLQYKNIVLSPATWLIKKEEVNAYPGATPKEKLVCCLKDLATSRYLKCGRGDQTLFFDTSDAEHLKGLNDYLLKEKEAYFEESWLPGNSLIKDEQGNPFMPQLILTLSHQQTIYRGIPEPLFKPTNTVIVPGQRWLYFEIFVHPMRADLVLCDYIQPFIVTNQSAIEKWFFVRYSQDGHHLRVRFQLTDQSYMQQIMPHFFSALLPLMEQGIISDIRIRPYRQETERYGEQFMENVEQHFYLDTCFTGAILQEATSIEEKYLWALKLLTDCRECDLLPPVIFDELIATNCAAYCQEQGLTPAGYKELNRAAKALNNSGELITGHGLLIHYMTMRDSLLGTLSLYEPQHRPVLFTALFHMLVNRLFKTDQRLQEAIIYCFFERSLKSVRGKATSALFAQ